MFEARFSLPLLTVRVSMALAAITGFVGCFGAPAMNYDIDEYNKAAVTSEKEMLLFNIGALHDKQPPHFMMLTTVSQTRMFTGSASFQWSQMLNALTPSTTITNSSSSVTTANPRLAQGGNWQAGPFAAGAAENPTIQFVPIQGSDFAQRFESSVTDKFMYFIQDLGAYTPNRKEAYQNLITLFAESLYLQHGETSPDAACGPGLMRNNGFGSFSECVSQILDSSSGLNYVQIDGSNPVPTVNPVAPAATDVVSALTSGYKWTKRGDDYQLTTPIRIPAWLDFDPEFVAPAKTEPPASTPVFWIESKPRWQRLQYTLPKDYSWQIYKIDKKDPNSGEVYALVPDGYELKRDEKERLKLDHHRHYLLVKSEEPAPHLAHGARRTGSEILTNTADFVVSDEGREMTGLGIAEHTKIMAVDTSTKTARLSLPATKDSTDVLSVGDVNQFSYADKVIHDRWPATQYFFYVELRKGEVGNAIAERVCHSENDDIDPPNQIICGYFKIGNLLQIMQRLADTVCTYTDDQSIATNCQNSYFGMGSSVPPWAENFAPVWPHNLEPYRRVTGGPFVWVPAHNPASKAGTHNGQDERNKAERDRMAFFDLYKLYQMSLVDTSKLVPGTPPITISK
jgi:hypothetical protein